MAYKKQIKLIGACHENWLGLATKKQLLEVFNLAMQLRNIYAVLCCYRLIVSVNLHALNTFYANKPYRLAKAFRKYIDSCGKTSGEGGSTLELQLLAAVLGEQLINTSSAVSM